MLGEGRFGESLLARDGRRADVEHNGNAGLAQRRDEGGHARALIANGKDRMLLSHFSLSLPDLPGQIQRLRAGRRGHDKEDWWLKKLSRRDSPGCGWRASREARACRSTAASSGT